MLGVNINSKFGYLLTEAYLRLIGFRKIGKIDLRTIYQYKTKYTLYTRINDFPLLVQINDSTTGKRLIYQYIYTIGDWKKITKKLNLR